ncbi:MAG: AI-2E family transporter [Pseudomonadota bacterium]
MNHDSQAGMIKIPEEPDQEATVVITATAIERLEALEGQSRAMSIALYLLAAIALFSALYLARAFFIPLLIGILGSYTLHPLVDWLKRFHIPRPLAAGLVVGLLVSILCWVGFTLSDDATAMIEKLPEAAHKIRKSLNTAMASGPSAFQHMQEAASEIQKAAAEATGVKANTRVAAATTDPTTWVRDYVLAQSMLLMTVLGQMPIVLLITYFLLASGSHFRRKLVTFVGPSLSRKKDAVQILDQIDAQIQRYMLVTLVSNALVALFTWAAFALLGMEHAGVWGAAAGVLHFIPYLGPALIALSSGVAAFMQFGSMLQAFFVVAASVLVSAAIGLGFTTWLQSRTASVNAAVLFIVLLFFGWLWGGWGLLLGAPLLAIAKVICARVDALKRVGQLLGS